MSDAIQAVISDLDGVVYRGHALIPGAAEAIRNWAALGIPYIFVTNNSVGSAAYFAEKLSALGIPVSADQVITTVEATARHIGRNFTPGVRTYVIGAPALTEAVAATGAEVVDSADADLLVLGTDYGLTFDKLRIAVQAILGGATVIATNPDRIAPMESGFEPCVGSILAVLTTAVPTLVPVIMGKPSPLMIEEALRRLGTARGHTIMVGDQIATDIRAGEAAGLRSFLITTGVPVGADAATGTHRIIDSLSEIEVVPAEAAA
ncbi:MAG TPA: HAD-IIA family hydrolase [Paenirhodobacter sp.]